MLTLLLVNSMLQSRVKGIDLIRIVNLIKHEG